MRKYLLQIALFVLCVTPAEAQTTTQQPNDAILQTCLLRTDPGTWNSLKLTPDQLRRARLVQQACAEECKASDMKKPQDSSMISASGTTVVDELKSVLTPDQFRTWSAWCAESTAPGQK